MLQGEKNIQIRRINHSLSPVCNFNLVNLDRNKFSAAVKSFHYHSAIAVMKNALAPKEYISHLLILA